MEVPLVDDDHVIETLLIERTSRSAIAFARGAHRFYTTSRDVTHPRRTLGLERSDGEAVTPFCEWRRESTERQARVPECSTMGPRCLVSPVLSAAAWGPEWHSALAWPHKSAR
jgi:hypothetical protein